MLSALTAAALAVQPGEITVRFMNAYPAASEVMIFLGSEGKGIISKGAFLDVRLPRASEKEVVFMAHPLRPGQPLERLNGTRFRFPEGADRAIVAITGRDTFLETAMDRAAELPLAGTARLRYTMNRTAKAKQMHTTPPNVPLSRWTIHDDPLRVKRFSAPINWPAAEPIHFRLTEFQETAMVAQHPPQTFPSGSAHVIVGAEGSGRVTFFAFPER